MKYPAVGDKVTATRVPKENRGYLTEGKEYEVISVPGSDSSFEVLSDRGQPLYCLYPTCAHAEWSISE